MKKLIFSFLTLIITLVAILVSGEGLVRLYLFYKYHVKQHTEGRAANAIVLDKELGWRSASNYSLTGDLVDASGNGYHASVTTDARGSRMWGHTSPAAGKAGDRKRLFFLGDSFTQALEVSDQKTYYAVLADLLPVEVFAYGAGGYGTLQEFMILDRYIERIAPDAVVLQYCYNDFYNNSFKLELGSSKNNNGMIRPYYASDGRIVYRLPKRFPAIRRIVNASSDYFRMPLYLLYKIDKFNAAYTDTLEKKVETEGVRVDAYQEAVVTTENLLRRFRKRVPPGIQVFTFAVDDNLPYYADFVSAARKAGLTVIEGIPQAVRLAEQEGQATRAADKVHWNETGHAIAGRKLSAYLEKLWKDAKGAK